MLSLVDRVLQRHDLVGTAVLEQLFGRAVRVHELDLQAEVFGLELQVRQPQVVARVEEVAALDDELGEVRVEVAVRHLDDARILDRLADPLVLLLEGFLLALVVGERGVAVAVASGSAARARSASAAVGLEAPAAIGVVASAGAIASTAPPSHPCYDFYIEMRDLPLVQLTLLLQSNPVM